MVAQAAKPVAAGLVELGIEEKSVQIVGGFILIRVNAGGTLTVDFASEVAASAVTIQPDAYLMAQELT